MLNSFFTVIVRVLSLFLMIGAGYACGKLGAVTGRGARQITSVLFYIVTPAVIISSLQSMIGKVSLANLLSAGGFSILCMAVSILISSFLFPKQIHERQKVLRFAAAYCNSGFMGLPLAQAVLGPAGAAYASMFIVVFNFFVWTHGFCSMSGTRKINWGKVFINPGLVGLVTGLPLFAFSVRLPEVLQIPVDAFAAVNTPLAMLVIGTYVSHVNLKEIFCDPDLYALSGFRLLLIPVACFLLMLPFHPNAVVAASMLILSASPSGANTVMFAAQFGGDTKLASKAVAFTTLLSVLTLPLLILLSVFF